MQNILGFRNGLALSALLIFLSGCGQLLEGIDDKNNEIAHTLGDIMGSADEVLMRSSTAFRVPEATFPERLWAQASTLLIPLAQAAGSCVQEFASACVGGERVVSYDACKLGPLTLQGSVKLIFTGGVNCSLSASGESVRRIPIFTVSGRSGGTLGVTIMNNFTSGQKLTRASNTSFSYEVSGLRRYLSNAQNERLVDLSIETTSPLQLSVPALNAATNRDGRVLTGGTLKVVDSISGETISLTPQALKWSSGCSCATSGSWTGQVLTKDAVTEDFIVEMKSCGSAEITRGSTKASITLERCVGV